ncbi:hypothetical protein [Tenuibacillus multivorans]|uniref:Uncharacterized protein n=1 Tax=Tenuibacillus multivorans TaxID=237069 RepID=A0A1G9X8V5_9BACI|nr:hypothetical protein [Tenuibacillus multivorans]GEL78669.1 hypothetical protein TMU01_29040 [Tenuibacillus multivorans]SDM92753.1 hypothetical protein SAMN05216498_1050 [Tenuibacillus multivorans]
MEKETAYYDGICFFAVKSGYNNENYVLRKNNAFPVQENKIKGFCRYLNRKFTLTKSIPIQQFMIESFSKVAVVPSGWTLMHGVPIVDERVINGYEITLLDQLEIDLNTLEHEFDYVLEP